MDSWTNLKSTVVMALFLLTVGCASAWAAQLHLRVTTDKDTYNIGHEVNWTIWAWASEGDNRGVMRMTVSLNDNRDEELDPAFTTSDPYELLDTEYGIEEGFDVTGAGTKKPTPPRLSGIGVFQFTKMLDIGNDGEPHVLAKGAYTVTRAGPHDLNVFLDGALYYPDEISDPCVFDAGDNFPASFDVVRMIYVDANTPDNNDGSNWANAYKYLQDALADANADPNFVEIYVADGNYYPDANTSEPNGSGNRAATFQLINGVALYGGYAGYGAPDPNERDIELYETILSGDLDGNDVDVNDPCDLRTEPSRGENSYHVVTGSGADPNAVLDGFTITAGSANGSDPCHRGGGMYNDSGSPTLANCTFSGNWAEDKGGGMFTRDSSPAATDCIFSHNSADNGGGMCNYNNGNPIVANCTFIGNSAGQGGAMWNRRAGAAE
ncbi:MAG: right-handed parallel beta-helix repeat-containing protein, partial [Planctomycetota bacterium]